MSKYLLSDNKQRISSILLKVWEKKKLKFVSFGMALKHLEIQGKCNFEYAKKCRRRIFLQTLHNQIKSFDI